MAGPGNILIRVGADASSAIRELRSVNRPLQDVQTRGERMSAGVRRAALPAAAALAAMGAAGLKAAQAAAEDQAAQAKLAGALQRTAGATAAQVSAAEDYISKLSLQVGVADDELRPALARLASATGDVGTAQERLKLALDISAQSGKSLDVVTKALAGAEDGRTTALGRLVPGLDAATLKSKDMAAITAELAEKTGGAAAEAANTATGRYRVMQVTMGELQETLGAALLPVLSILVSVLQRATTFASAHTTAVKIVAGAVAAFAAAIILANIVLKLHAAGTKIASAATKAYAAIQWLLNAALSANPIGIVVVAVAALVAGVVIAYRRSETFRDAVGKLWTVIKNTPLGLLIRQLDDVASAASRVVGWIKDVVEWIGKIDFPDVPGWVPGFGGSSSAPAAAARALGPRGSSSPASSAPRSLGPSSSSSILSGGITINIFGASDPEGTARAVKRTLRGFERRHGTFATVQPT